MALPNRGHRPRRESPRGHPLTENLRDTFRALRKMQGLTLEQVGARYDPPISGKAVSELERGWGEMRIGTAAIHAAALGGELTFGFKFTGDTDAT